MKKETIRKLRQNGMKLAGNTGFLVLLTGIISTLIMAYALRVWRSDPQILFSSDRNALYFQTLVQNFLETGSALRSHRLGGTFGLNYAGLEGADALFFGGIAILSLFTGNSALLLNLLYLLSFPISAMTAVYTLRSLRVSPAVSLSGGLLFAFLPYHFWHGTSDVFLASYFMIPLGVMAMLRVMNRESAILPRKHQAFRSYLRSNRGPIFLLLISLVISSTGFDYAFFYMLLMLVAVAVCIAGARRFTSSAATGLICFGLTGTGLVLNRLPTVVAKLSGQSPASWPRLVADAETYSLKLIDLIVPYGNHQLGRIRNMVEVFHRAEPLLNENRSVALGILGACGFALALAVPVIFRKADTSGKQQFHYLSILTYTAVILSTLGGFGSLIYRFVFPDISKFYRISVYIAFLAFYALALFIDAIIYGKIFTRPTVTEKPSNPLGRGLFGFVSALRKHRAKAVYLLLPLIFLGLFDIIPVNSAFPYQANAAGERDLSAFFTRAEAAVPTGSLVFVLPYTGFPAEEESTDAAPYALFEAYLHTDTLRFSNGAPLGCEADLWYKNTASLPPEELIAALRASGYSAIYIDLLHTSEDSTKDTANALIRLCDQKPVISSDEMRYFLPIG